MQAIHLTAIVPGRVMKGFDRLSRAMRHGRAEDLELCHVNPVFLHREHEDSLEGYGAKALKRRGLGLFHALPGAVGTKKARRPTHSEVESVFVSRVD